MQCLSVYVYCQTLKSMRHQFVGFSEYARRNLFKFCLYSLEAIFQFAGIKDSCALNSDFIWLGVLVQLNVNSIKSCSCKQDLQWFLE